MKSIEDCKIVKIPKIHDVRGNLSVIEGRVFPKKIERVYYLYDVPSDSRRGGHAHRKQYELLIAVSGSFEVSLDDANQTKNVLLNKPDIGLLIPTGIWRELDNFSSGSVCLVLNSGKFKESDYIRDYADFKSFKRR